MPYINVLISYVLTCAVFFAIDLVWLGVVAKDIYGKYLKDFLRPEINWQAAIFFYLLFMVWLLLFAIYPAVAKDDWVRALVLGGLFGLFTYATYDLTNLATLKWRPIQIVYIDIVWWIVLCAAVSVAGFFIVKWVG